MAGLSLKAVQGLHLRARLLRRSVFRLWRDRSLQKYGSSIGTVRYEDGTQARSPVPMILLVSCSRPEDLPVLAYLFRERILTCIVPRALSHLPLVSLIARAGRILYFENYEKPGYPFFRELLRTLQDFNRSVLVSPDAAKVYSPNHFTVVPPLLVRLAMKASVPIVPVVTASLASERQGRQPSGHCDIFVGKRIFVSPRSPEFRDIFFKRRGARKFERLPPEDLAEIGRRIFTRLDALKETHGSDLS